MGREPPSPPVRAAPRQDGGALPVLSMAPEPADAAEVRVSMFPWLFYFSDALKEQKPRVARGVNCYRVRVAVGESLSGPSRHG